MMGGPTPEAFATLQTKLDVALVDSDIDPAQVEALQLRLGVLRHFGSDTDDESEFAAIYNVLEELIKSEPDPGQWPEPQPISSEVSVPHLPENLVPSPLRPWLSDAAERLSVPLEMVTIPALVAVGAAIGRSAALFPKRHDTWSVVPNLWGVVIAPSSSMKTPALEEGTKPLSRIASNAIAAHESTRRKREADASILEAQLANLNRQARSPSPPSSLANDIADMTESIEKLRLPARRFTTSDSTVEMLTELLRDNPRGLLVKRDELVGLLETYDKKGREGDREFYLEAFNSAENFTVDRIGRGTVHVPALTLSIVGGIQPGKIDAIVLGAVSGRREADGLLQRFQLAVYPEPLTEYKHVDRPIDQKAYDRVSRLFELLTEFDPAAHPELPVQTNGLAELRFSDEAQARFDEWFIAHMNRIRGPELAATPALQAHLGKYQAMVAKLVMIFHLLAVIETAHITPVSVEAVTLALDWSEFLEAHARKIYAQESRQVTQGVQELATRILDGEVQDGSTARDVYRRGWRGLSDAKSLSDAAHYLEGKGWLRIEKATNGSSGRPSEIIRLNPQLKPTLDEA